MSRVSKIEITDSRFPFDVPPSSRSYVPEPTLRIDAYLEGLPDDGVDSEPSNYITIQNRINLDEVSVDIADIDGLIAALEHAKKLAESVMKNDAFTL